MSKKSCKAAESIEDAIHTIECSRSVHSIVWRMARVNRNNFLQLPHAPSTTAIVPIRMQRSARLNTTRSIAAIPVFRLT